jgi:uncharacterized surface protein with fasciclin (FAS1) repeats
MSRFRAVVLALALAALIGPAPWIPAHAADAYTVMKADKRFRTWVRMIDTAGLEGYARGGPPRTVFAVVEESLQNIDPGLLKAIGPQTYGRNADTSQMRFVVRTHVTNGKIPLSQLAGKVTTLKSINGRDIVIDGTKSPMTVTTAGSQGTVQGDPIVTSNAIIYPTLVTSAHYVPE